MPTPHIADIRPFIERLIRDPGAALVDEAFARAFNRLPTASRRAIMERVEGVRWQAAATERLARGYGASEERVQRSLRGVPGQVVEVSPGMVQYIYAVNAQSQDRLARPRRPPAIVTVNVDDMIAQRRFVDPAENRPSPHITDESSSVVASPALSQAARIEQMRRDMVREIDEYRANEVARYQARPVEIQGRGDFEAWSQHVENVVQSIRDRWESRVAMEEDRFTLPTPPVMAWPDPTEYGPNGRYATQRGALSAFTRAVNVAYASVPVEHAPDESRDRVHINGTRDIREAWRGWQRVPDPPPTTTAWVDEPEIDEFDILIKHLPHGRKFMLVVSDYTTLSNAGRKLVAAGITGEYYHIHTVKMMVGASSNAVRVLRYPVFIDPAVFKMHARREGDWTDEELDAIIELQGEIPDEGTAT